MPGWERPEVGALGMAVETDPKQHSIIRVPILCFTHVLHICRQITWDLPDDVRPTTAVGLSDKSIADRQISKHSLCSAEGVSGRCQAMMRPKTPCVRAFIGDPRRPCASPPPSAAVSTVLAVIPAPSRAGAPSYPLQDRPEPPLRHGDFRHFVHAVR